MAGFCTNCGARVGDARYCTNCGARRSEDEAPAAHGPVVRDAAAREASGRRAAGQKVAARLMACPACGAVNAASRSHCARCGVDLAAEPPFGAPGSSADGAAIGPAVDRDPHDADALPAAAVSVADDLRLPGVLVLVTIVVSVITLAVALTLLSARGIGPFAGPDAASGLPSETSDIPVADIEASSAVPADPDTTYDAANLVDDDPTTAWNEGVPGDGQGEWVELALEDAGLVTGVLVWNGYQSGDFYAQHNRVRELRLILDDRTFSVELLDRRGPQAINLPEPVPAERIRLEIAEVFPGTVYNDAALSELQVRGLPRQP